VHGHELLLLADRVEKAKCVRAEADQRDGSEREQAQRGGGDHAPALAPTRRSEHEKGQRQSCRDLDRHAHDQGRGAGAKARAGAGCQRERSSEHHHDQRVVVRSADREHQQHRVQPDERHRPALRLADLCRGACDQRDRAEAGGDGERLERPQPSRQPERRGRIAAEREQRAIGRVLVGPAEKPEHFVARRLRRHVRVGVKAVQRSQPRKAQVAEDILGDQRRAQQQDRVRGEHRRDQRAHRQRAREAEHQQVARAHDQRQRLKGARAEGQAQALQRTRQPARPTAASRGHVLRRFAGRARDRQEDRRDDAQQADRADRARDRSIASRRWAAGGAESAVGAADGLDRHAGRSRGGRHLHHCCV
jgi:hypothetical protein